NKLGTRGEADGESLEGRWSPDGSRISFTTDSRGRQEIAVATYQAGKLGRIERMTAGIHDEYQAVWRPDGRALDYLHNEDASVSIRRVFAVSHADHAVADLPGTHSAQAIGPDNDRTVYLYSSPTQPWDVFITGERMSGPRAVPRPLPSRLDYAPLLEPLHI